MSNIERLNAEAPDNVPTCTRADFIQGKPGAMVYHFSPTLGRPQADEIVRKLLEKYTANFIFPNSHTGFRYEGDELVLDVPLSLTAEWVDTFFGALNNTGMISIDMPLHRFPHAPKPLVDHRKPLFVDLKVDERLERGFHLEVGPVGRAQNEARSHMAWFVFGPGNEKRKTIPVPQGMSMDDVRIVTAKDDPNEQVLWEFTDGVERYIRRGDIPKEL